ncbi:CBR-PMS-2 protein [Aphelenchoides bicaudatus]|nr:CBR-PMS-2 protein [Aphelenchoides bicaudatus]
MSVSPGSVQKLGKSDIRQISTSQVIASLSGACRELIDNALDAEATNIEIRAVENGVSQLEVIDNGSGIIPSNFDRLAKPHSTSKLSDFSDFNRLLTFGFRGEALNALAALSNLVIITCHKSEQVATRLEFNSEGQIVKRTPCARPVGTTVILGKIFERLPVRRKQFIASAKDQFQKLLNGVQSFALSRRDVRFCAKNTLGTKTTAIFTTQGKDSTLKSVISNLFGAQAEKQAMLEIKDAEPNSEVLEMYSLPPIKDEELYKSIKVSGFVSSCLFGQGRSSTDRQFVFVNGRPVDYNKMCKVANDVYGSFNRGRYCVLILFIDLDPSQIDVNVAPDKRQVFLRNEKEVFAKLRACLLATFEEVMGDCAVQAKNTQLRLNFEKAMGGKGSNKKNTKSKDVLNVEPSQSLRSKVSSETSLQLEPFRANNVNDQPVTIPLVEDSESLVEENPMPAVTAFHRPLSTMLHGSGAQRNGSTKSRSESSKITSEFKPKNTTTAKQNVVNTESVNAFRVSTNSPIVATDLNESVGEPVAKRAKTSVNQVNQVNNRQGQGDCTNKAGPSHNKTSRIDLSLSQRAPNAFDATIASSTGGNKRLAGTGLAQDIQEEAQTNVIERRLSMMLKKDDFNKMQVIGQFNKAFILTRLGQELFVLDQHASDEKYNFERLQKVHKMQRQALVCPQTLSVGVIYEAVIVDNMEIFNANGFYFNVDENEPSGRRIRLVSAPSVRGITLGASEVEEIAGVLNKYPGMMYRPQRVRAIFASWACRSSIMVGKALKPYEMRRIVRNMADMENPWNCPHGRPTIRHLGTLDCVLTMPHIFNLVTAAEKRDAANENKDDDIEVLNVTDDDIEILDDDVGHACDEDVENRIQPSTTIIDGSQIIF